MMNIHMYGRIICTCVLSAECRVPRASEATSPETSERNGSSIYLPSDLCVRRIDPLHMTFQIHSWVTPQKEASREWVRRRAQT